jgi:hypothetical protein
MKKAAILALVVVFAACLIHFYYAEDHCPVHCPARGGRFGHVHPHHAGASVCLCFWGSLMGPETNVVPANVALVFVLARADAGRVTGMMATDITPPPRSSLV